MKRKKKRKKKRDQNGRNKIWGKSNKKVKEGPKIKSKMKKATKTHVSTEACILVGGWIVLTLLYSVID